MFEQIDSFFPTRHQLFQMCNSFISHRYAERRNESVRIKRQTRKDLSEKLSVLLKTNLIETKIYILASFVTFLKC